jgi:ABC-type transport system involved in multi-copper enzyme maturation permease subunit
VSTALAIVDYTFRACLPTKRRLGLLLLAAVTVLFGLLARGSDETGVNAVVGTPGFAVFFLVLPIGALVVGDAVLGAEIRSGVFAFTWLSPARLTTILLGRWLAGTLITCLALVPAVVIAAIVGGAPEAGAPFAVATAAGAACYLAVFLAIGATFRRAPAVALVYVFLFERLLGTALSSIAQVSPGWLADAVLTGFVRDDLADSDLVRDGVPQGGGAIFRMVIVTVVALLLALRGLRRLRIAGAAD